MIGKRNRGRKKDRERKKASKKERMKEIECSGDIQFNIWPANELDGLCSFGGLDCLITTVRSGRNLNLAAKFNITRVKVGFYCL